MAKLHRVEIGKTPRAVRVPVEALGSTSALFRDYIHDWTRVEPFYSHRYTPEAILGFARRDVGLGQEQRRRLSAVLESQQRHWNIDPGPAGRLGSGAVAVIAGQQAGLFTGPMFAILKALTAVKIARRLCRSGIDAVPVFWIASEDHDSEEIAWAGVVDQASVFRRINANLSHQPGAPVGWLRFAAGLDETIGECFGRLPATEFRDEVVHIVRDAYQEGRSPVDAFAIMMGRLFADRDLILVDPLESGFRDLSESVLGALAANVDAVRAAVLERGRRISSAGYTEQVRVDDAFTGLFAYRGGLRKPLRVGESAPPDTLSPSALLRPFVQDSLFPTAAFVAGPAEIAYLAQAGAVYACMGAAMPPIVPRISATVVEPAVARAMKKYGFEIADVFRGPDFLRTKAVGSIRDTASIRRARDQVAAVAESLRPVLEGSDPTLGGALDTALRKVRYQFDRLDARLVNAEVRRDEVLERHLRTVSSSLFPNNKLQERAVNVTSLLVRYGPSLVRLLDERLETEPGVHQVVEL